MTSTDSPLLSQRQLLDRARRAYYPRHDGWRVVVQSDTGVRLRRNGRVAQVAYLCAADPSDPDPERALFAALGRPVITWEDPPGLGRVRCGRMQGAGGHHAVAESGRDAIMSTFASFVDT
ncbi:MAG: hypothetical protein MUF00_20605 [Gemmatimonadaceae bacterium]|nr:hypothetical protein [Gemmatimonadaceae bacterium]